MLGEGLINRLLEEELSNNQTHRRVVRGMEKLQIKSAKPTDKQYLHAAFIHSHFVIDI